MGPPPSGARWPDTPQARRFREPCRSVQERACQRRQVGWNTPFPSARKTGLSTGLRRQPACAAAAAAPTPGLPTQRAAARCRAPPAASEPEGRTQAGEASREHPTARLPADRNERLTPGREGGAEAAGSDRVWTWTRRAAGTASAPGCVARHRTCRERARGTGMRWGGGAGVPSLTAMTADRAQGGARNLPPSELCPSGQLRPEWTRRPEMVGAEAQTPARPWSSLVAHLPHGSLNPDGPPTPPAPGAAATLGPPLPTGSDCQCWGEAGREGGLGPVPGEKRPRVHETEHTRAQPRTADTQFQPSVLRVWHEHAVLRLRPAGCCRAVRRSPSPPSGGGAGGLCAQWEPLGQLWEEHGRGTAGLRGGPGGRGGGERERESPCHRPLIGASSCK